MPTRTRKTITFGVELEASEVSAVAPSLISKHNFKRVRDGSIKEWDRARERPGADIPDDVCGEIITPPISVSFTVETGGSVPVVTLEQNQAWTIVRDLCKCAEKVNPTCGLHIHLGKPVGTTGEQALQSAWNDEEISAWLLAGVLLENKLFNVVPSSRLNSRFCRRMGNMFSANEMTSATPLGIVESNKYRNDKRYCWLNLVETKRIDSRRTRPLGTVEIRMLGNTRRVDYVWSWIKLWLKVAAVIAYHQPTHAVRALAFGNILDADFADIDRTRRQARDRGNVPPNVRPEDMATYMSQGVEPTEGIPMPTEADEDDHPVTLMQRAPATRRNGGSSIIGR